MQISLVELAGIITAVTVIITCIYRVYNLARSVEEKLESYDKNLQELNMHLNKMALLDTNLPLVDRLHAGEWYLSHGGNGIGRKVYDQLVSDLDTSGWDNKKWASSLDIKKKGDKYGK